MRRRTSSDRFRISPSLHKYTGQFIYRLPGPCETADGAAAPSYREMPVMPSASLTFRSIKARPLVLKLRRPVVARIATITDWPLILIDLFTEEGIVGRSYLEHYTVKTMRYLVSAMPHFS